VKIFKNLRWRTAAILENVGNAITCSPMDQFGWNLGSRNSHPIVSQPWFGCHGNGRCLATAHWTFSSYGRLEAERVIPFWWNLVQSSKFGTELAVTWPNMIFVLKIKMTFWAPVLMLMRSKVAAKFGRLSGIASADTATSKPWPLPASRTVNIQGLLQKLIQKTWTFIAVKTHRSVTHIIQQKSFCFLSSIWPLM